MNKITCQHALPPGAMVQEYRIDRILGVGNFGIVYSAKNTHFNETAALKEFLPTDLACRIKDNFVAPTSSYTDKAYRSALKKFLNEARILRELGCPVPHRNIVRVRQFIKANDTGYMVMDLEQGQPLSDILEEQGTLSEAEIIRILEPLLKGLERIHQANVLHRDIKPSNILIRPDGSPVLIDFGAARREVAKNDPSTMSQFTPAYAALEQVYPAGAQGPWTDIYALAATLYRAVTANKPTNSVERLRGMTYTNVTLAVKGDYTQAFLNAIDAALALNAEDRPQSIMEWRTLLFNEMGRTSVDDEDETIHRPGHQEYQRFIDLPEKKFPNSASPNQKPVQEDSSESASRTNLLRKWTLSFALFAVFISIIGLGIYRYFLQPSASTGSILVTIEPTEVLQNGAKWRINKQSWQNSGDKITNIATGIHEIEFKDVNGWRSPGNKFEDIESGKEIILNGLYIRLQNQLINDNFKVFFIKSDDNLEVSELEMAESLTHNDYYYITYNPYHSVHLYIAQIDSIGMINILFPNAKNSTKINPLEPGIDYRFPEQEADFFYVDEKTTGKEWIYALASIKRVDDVEKLLNELTSADDIRKKELSEIFLNIVSSHNYANLWKIWFWHKG